jgi:AcrR family transcriptional regulator
MVNPAGTRGQVTRARLLAAALEGFVSLGYHGTTTAFLAERTGIAEGTIYRHYPGKDALYSAVALQAWEQATAAVLEEPTSRVSARERLSQAGRRLVGEAATAPLVIRFVLGGQGGTGWTSRPAALPTACARRWPNCGAGAWRPVRRETAAGGGLDRGPSARSATGGAGEWAWTCNVELAPRALGDRRVR